jgi:hypothetical protein
VPGERQGGAAYDGVADAPARPDQAIGKDPPRDRVRLVGEMSSWFDERRFKVSARIVCG